MRTAALGDSCQQKSSTATTKRVLEKVSQLGTSIRDEPGRRIRESLDDDSETCETLVDALRLLESLPGGPRLRLPLTTSQINKAYLRGGSPGRLLLQPHLED